MRTCEQCHKAKAERYSRYCQPCIDDALPEKEKKRRWLKPDHEKSIYKSYAVHGDK